MIMNTLDRFFFAFPNLDRQFFKDFILFNKILYYLKNKNYICLYNSYFYNIHRHRK